MSNRYSTLLVRWVSAMTACFLVLCRSLGDIQFDAFVGYDSTVRAGGWYPVAFEVFNDGPSFDGVVEVTSAQVGGQLQRYALSLPNGTRKRWSIPMFSSSSTLVSVDIKLLDADGKLRAERGGLRPSVVGWENVLVGGLAASSQGGPIFPITESARTELQPRVARMLVELFPDNPIALEGLNALYLNSAKALDLKEPQVEALQSWLHGGGHLIVGIDQPGDLNTATWLRGILPASVGGLTSRRFDGELHRWLTDDATWHPTQSGSTLRHAYEPPKYRLQSELRVERPESAYAGLKADRDFDSSELPVSLLKPLASALVSGPRDAPWMVSAAQGRGLVTLLAFNPERDPFKGWKLRPYFWARLTGVPDEVFRKEAQNVWGGKSVDSIYGAMIETRQVRKLPVGLLLLLLLVYLVVIGPLDQWWLKKINRPMLTWITFPAYVALFSLLIYFIGFRLRAGQTEWNELHVVDVLPRSGDAVLRGRTFAGIYSPANETYRVANEVQHATLRGEFSGLWGGAAAEGRATLNLSQKPGISADIYVPVWSSQLNVIDWQQVAAPPIAGAFSGGRNGGTLRLSNPGSRPFSKVWVVVNRELFELGELAAGATQEFSLAIGKNSKPIRQWVQRFGETFRNASMARDRVLGGNEGTHIDAWDESSVAAAFVSMLSASETQNRDFVYPAGLDLTPLAERGDTIVMAWMRDETLVPAMNRFTAFRSAKGTLLRLVLPGSVDAK
jgi:hypothetical protein